MMVSAKGRFCRSTVSCVRFLVLTSFSCLLAGCEVWQVATFDPHALSNQKSDHLELVLQSPGAAGYYCAAPGPAPAVAPVVGPVVTAVVDQIIGAASDEIAAYVDKKKKEFTTDFSAQVTLPALIVYAPAPPRLAFDCITVTEKLKDSSNGFKFSGRIQPTADLKSAYIVPISYSLSKSSAKTANATATDPGKVDVDLRIQIKSIVPDDKGIGGEKVIADQTLHFPGLELPPPKSPAMVKSYPDPAKMPITSSWFALPTMQMGTNPFPSTVAVEVTENGTGSPDYATAKSDITDGLKNANTDLGKIIDSLTKKQN